MNRDQIAEVIAKLRRHYVGAANELEDDLGEAIGLLLAIQSDGWQKIDSAPRDGTPILAFNPAVGVYSTAFTTRWTGEPAEYEAATQGQPTYEGFPCGFWSQGPHAYPFGQWDVSPRFWRPLPQPPGDAG